MIFKRIFIKHLWSSCIWLYQFFASSLLVPTRSCRLDSPSQNEISCYWRESDHKEDWPEGR